MKKPTYPFGSPNQKDIKISTIHIASSFVQGKACFMTKFMFDSCHYYWMTYVFAKKWLITLRNELNKELREV